MSTCDRSKAFELFKKSGINSSHFVWFLDKELQFFETSQGWIFAFRRIGDVTLIALEPLIPQAPTDSECDRAWNEFKQNVSVKIVAFISVYEPFVPWLRRSGFTVLKVGQEPWIDLKDCIPTGNSGKGVRSARNQAIAAGMQVEEWSASEIASDPEKTATIKEIYSDWKSQRVAHLGGFLNSTDPFAHMDIRKYFILRSPRRIEGYLIATPVPASQSYFLEDLILRQSAPRGSGELVTLEAMIRLRDLGAKKASLGVISVNQIEIHKSDKLPKAVEFFILTVPKYMKMIYNFNGMTLYRKRFKPHEWKNIYLGLVDTTVQTKPHLGAWAKTAWAIFKAFSPRLQISGRWLVNSLLRPVKRYPLTSFAVIVSVLNFAFINHFSVLPDWALGKFGFFADAPLREWVVRSLVSDYLYFDVNHFLTWGTVFFIALFWAEKTHSRKFIIPFVLMTGLLDDFINYGMLTWPFEYFQPTMFKFLVSYKDVGSSLMLTTLIGLQICQFRVIREPLFVITAISMVLAFVFTSPHLHWLVVNLNHFVFLAGGYLCGKIHFEYIRYQSRKVSKGKPPTSRTVSPPPQRKAA